jgi:UDP-N-acetylmuramyl pentapeptide phosphotransferase/UDP-N-acetylglucosamine-1-phosphate transferase
MCRRAGHLYSAFTFGIVPATTLITEIMVPFYKYPVLSGGLVVLILTVLTIVGSSNAVNLTDGLDGLAIGCTVIVSFVFVVLTYLAGNATQAAYLQIPYVSGAGELTVFCSAIIGVRPGFPLVQLPSSPGFHGRYRFPGAGRRPGDHRRAHSSAARAGHRRRQFS